MAVTTVNLNIAKALINSDGNLELNYSVTRDHSSEGDHTLANYAPLRLAIDNQTTFICKNEESTNSYKIGRSRSQGDGGLVYTTDTLIGAVNITTYNVNQTFDLSASAFTPQSDLFFVYIYSQNGTTAREVTPEYLEAVVPVYNEENLYNKILNIIKSDYTNCSTECKNNNVNSAYIINLYNGFKLALANGDYKTAIVFWNNLETHSYN